MPVSLQPANNLLFGCDAPTTSRQHRAGEYITLPANGSSPRRNVRAPMRFPLADFQLDLDTSPALSSQDVMNSSAVVNIEDLRVLAQRRLPKAVFDYLDGGAEAECTLAENCRVFRDVLFRPRSAVAVGDCD